MNFCWCIRASRFLGCDGHLGRFQHYMCGIVSECYYACYTTAPYLMVWVATIPAHKVKCFLWRFLCLLQVSSTSAPRAIWWCSHHISALCSKTSCSSREYDKRFSGTELQRSPKLYNTIDRLPTEFRDVLTTIVWIAVATRAKRHNANQWLLRVSSIFWPISC